ncbi:MAG: aspartyl/glutamyl-tRNA(Asn/Gln) amidotransferase, C subunit [Haloquadratum sp. J07HQX50]|nr:MAG: aspartyl/glutamyl-tRNA(Asn/Gln) amidotransferase, C subunit [Haloquadratum sp. J07HQX50]
MSTSVSDILRLGLITVQAGNIETLSLQTRQVWNMSDEPVNEETVKHVAELARIELADDEVDRFASQFDTILSYFEALDEVPEVDHEPPLVNVMRADTVETGLSHDEATQNADETEDGFFKGPNVS